MISRAAGTRRAFRLALCLLFWIASPGLAWASLTGLSGLDVSTLPDLPSKLETAALEQPECIAFCAPAPRLELEAGALAGRVPDRSHPFALGPRGERPGRALFGAELGTWVVEYANDNPTRFVDPTGHEATLAEAAAKERARRAGLSVHAEGTFGADPGGRLTEGEVLVGDRSSKLERDMPWLDRSQKDQDVQVVEEESELVRGTENKNLRDLFAHEERRKKEALEAIGTFGDVGTKASEFGLSMAAGTAGDAVTAYGIDPITGEEVDTATRWIAVAGVLIPGLSGSDLKIAKELAEEAAKARKPFRHLLSGDEVKKFEHLRESYPDFMPDLDTAARALKPADVREARRVASRGGHHRHPLAFEGEPKPSEGLVPTGDTRYGKGEAHKEVSNFWNDVLRRLRNQEKP